MQISLATDPGAPGAPNQDWTGVTQGANSLVATVLDGVSSSGDGAGCQHGTPWFVQHLGAALLALAEDPRVPLQDALADALGQVRDLHPECDHADPGQPSSTVALVRVTTAHVDWLVLSDSSVIIETESDIATYTDAEVEKTARDQQEQVAQHAIGSRAHREAMAGLVAEQQRQRNRDGGYWVAASDAAAADYAITGSEPRGAVSRVLLASDGVMRLVEFGRATNYELLNNADQLGPDALITQVREAEFLDPDGTRWPRYKRSDDATCVLINLDREKGV